MKKNLKINSSNLWLKKKYTIASDSYVIGYVGRVTQFKKTLFLLEAFNKILSFYEKQNLKLHCIIFIKF